MVDAATPDAALLAWVRTAPAVRCAAPAFRAWTATQDAPVVPVTPVSGERFARTAFSAASVAGLVKVAGRPNERTFSLARVPTAHAVVLHAEAPEENFTAVVPQPKARPPQVVEVLPIAPQAHRLGLGSKRADVERVLGRGTLKRLCDYRVVRYEVRPAEASVSEVWFFYRDDRVAAIARYEAV